MSLCAALASAAAAQIEKAPPKPAPAAFRLVSSVDAVVPGSTLTLGLAIEHLPGWHTYWKNPGTVGMATRVIWKLPEGCTAGPLQWQRPQRTKMGIYTVWGYEGRALLLTDIVVPQSLEAKGTLRFAADVSYMACAKTCNPGHAKVAIELPLRQKAKPIAVWRPRFDEVRRQQPRRLRHAWEIRATRAGEIYTLTLTPKSGANPDIKRLQFFGSERLVSSDAPQEFYRVGKQLVLRMRREKFTPDDSERLRGLLFCAGGFLADGSVTSLAVDARL